MSMSLFCFFFNHLVFVVERQMLVPLYSHWVSPGSPQTFRQAIWLRPWISRWGLTPLFPWSPCQFTTQKQLELQNLQPKWVLGLSANYLNSLRHTVTHTNTKNPLHTPACCAAKGFVPTSRSLPHSWQQGPVPHHHLCTNGKKTDNSRKKAKTNFGLVASLHYVIDTIHY